jgi:hypothetical protein
MVIQVAYAGTRGVANRRLRWMQSTMALLNRFHSG